MFMIVEPTYEMAKKYLMLSFYDMKPETNTTIYYTKSQTEFSKYLENKMLKSRAKDCIYFSLS